MPRDPESLDPMLTVDEHGSITSVHAWPWPDPPEIGEALADRFDLDSEAAVRRLSERRWVGVGEHRLTLRTGRAVNLTAGPVAGGFRIALYDVTLSSVLDQATEQRKRMRVVSQLAGTLARELIDPMSIVQGRLELLLDVGENDPVALRRHLGIALEHSRRVTATLSNLRLLGRTAGPPEVPVPFEEVVEGVLALLGPKADRVLPQIEPRDLAIGCDPALPVRVCASLARQALEAAGRGPIHLRARRVRAQIQVRLGPSGRASNEPGPEADELALDRTLLASVGGSLVTRRIGTTPQFEFTLPAPPSQRARRRPVRARILIVGASVGEAIPQLLHRDGYAFDAVDTADDAIAALERHPCDVVIAELLLDGGASALSLAQEVSNRFEQTRVIVVAEGGDLPAMPLPVVPLRWPASRADLLAALGTRVRR